MTNPDGGTLLSEEATVANDRVRAAEIVAETPVAPDRSGAARSNAARAKADRPRTEKRQRRIREVLRRRQPDLTVVLEDVHDPHNAAAVLRSCDAVGVMRVHFVYDIETPPAKRFARTTSASATKWVETRAHPTIEACFDHLRAQGMQILATTLTDESVDLYSCDLTRPTAIVMGNEHRGLSAKAIHLADATVKIPMMGMVESLNISVATAVTLFEALRQRRQAGYYEQPRLDAETLAALEEAWLKK